MLLISKTVIETQTKHIFTYCSLFYIKQRKVFNLSSLKKVSCIFSFTVYHKQKNVSLL